MCVGDKTFKEMIKVNWAHKGGVLFDNVDAFIRRARYAGAVSDMWRHSKKKDDWNPGRVAHQTRNRHSDLGLLASVLSYFSHVRLFVTLWTVAHQALLSMKFSRQEYWSGLPFPTSGELLDPGIKPAFLVSPALAGRFFTTSTSLFRLKSRFLQRSLPSLLSTNAVLKSFLIILSTFSNLSCILFMGLTCLSISLSRIYISQENNLPCPWLY